MALCLLLALPAWAGDAPRRILLENGDERWNREAVEAVDHEFKRLQQVEKDSESEKKRIAQNGAVFVVIALATGVAVGLGVGVGVGLAVRR